MLKYNPENECCIIWNDKVLNIDWSIISPLLSKKDKNALSFDKNFKLKQFCIKWKIILKKILKNQLK